MSKPGTVAGEKNPMRFYRRLLLGLGVAVLMLWQAATAFTALNAGVLLNHAVLMAAVPVIGPLFCMMQMLLAGAGSPLVLLLLFAAVLLLFLGSAYYRDRELRGEGAPESAGAAAFTALTENNGQTVRMPETPARPVPRPIPPAPIPSTPFSSPRPRPIPMPPQPGPAVQPLQKVSQPAPMPAPLENAPAEKQAVRSGPAEDPVLKDVLSILNKNDNRSGKA